MKQTLEAFRDDLRERAGGGKAFEKPKTPFFARNLAAIVDWISVCVICVCVRFVLSFCHRFLLSLWSEALHVIR